jgi:hypothetical protein
LPVQVTVIRHRVIQVTVMRYRAVTVRPGALFSLLGHRRRAG